MGRIIQFLTLLQKSYFMWRLTSPWIWGAISVSFKFMLISVAAIWRSVPQVLEDTANEWVDQATFAGSPTNITPILYHIMWWLGLVSVVIGWVILSYLTVFITRLIF